MQTIQTSSAKSPAMSRNMPAMSEQDKIALYPRKVKKLDKISTSFTFINCCVGSGVLSLGIILHTVGYVPYAIYQFLSLAFCVFTFEVISMANYCGNFATISDCVRCIWGKNLGLAVDISIVASNMGFLTAYVSVSADYIREGI